MSRFRHALSLAMIALIACASFAVAPHAQVAQAAGKIFTVTTTDDAFSDPSAGCAETIDENNLPGCTLREALNAANTAGNEGSTIDFNIPFGDPGFVDFPNSAAWIITPTIALPPINKDGTIIDGSTQTDRLGNTNNDGAEIIISGSNITNAGGIRIFASGNTVRGIGIINFLGSNTQSLRGVGIEIAPLANNNTIQGNYIGLGISATGTVAAPNRDAGVIIAGSNNLVGGNNTTLTTEFNVISGNNGDGILINGGQQNKIGGNYIGTNAAISAAIPNGGDGINIRANANGNIIGNYLAQSSVSARNFIGGNGGYGIQISDSSNNKIYGNFIGLSRSGTGKISNALGGIRIDGTSTNTATGNEVGGTVPGVQYTRNIIVGDNGPGIQLNGFGARSNRIVANYVGIGSTGSVPAGGTRFTSGIVVTNGASDNVVGGGILNERNVVAGIDGDAVQVTGFSQGNSIIRARNNKIQGNYLGVGPNGAAAIPNTGAGILLNNYVNNTQIGGNGTGEGNRIENNGADGIQITGVGIISNTVLSNIVRANIGNGVRVNPATTAMTTTLSNNVIELNGGDGMQIAGAINTTIFSNTVEANGQINGQPSGTGGTGIQITRGVSTTINATTVISNALNGLALDTSDNARIINNTINGNGTVTTTTALMRNGISVAGSNVISITNNTVLTNAFDGVLIGDALFGSKQVRVTDNSISANGGLGINLDPETQGEPGILTNPNHDIDAPFNIHVNQDGLVTGRVLAIANQPAACRNCLIQVFATNPEKLDGQGKTKYTSSVEISSNGYFTSTVGTVPGQLALTATDDKGNTSEFGVFTANYGGLTATLGLDIGPARAGSAAPSEVISYTHRITNTSNIDYTDLSLSAVSSQGWTTAVAPPAPIALAAGQSKPVTLTLTLPKAPNKSVLAGTIDLTRMTVQSTRAVSATASVTDTTTVLSAFKLEVDPLGANGRVLPGKVITYSHTLRNVGNLTGTLVLSASTTPTTGWTTNITPTTVTLGPGQEDSVRIGVGSPAGAVEGTTARTTVGIQITDPTGQAPISFVDTTRVSLQPLVTIVPNNEGEVEAGQTITFRHFVTNESNGAITLKLTARKTGLGSTVEFRSATAGVTLSPDGTFTLAKGAQLELLVDITVPERARAGSSDLVTISLSQEDGTLVGSVQDTVKVTANAFLPALYLPLIRK